jgi:hypothetical protein
MDGLSEDLKRRGGGEGESRIERRELDLLDCGHCVRRRGGGNNDHRQGLGYYHDAHGGLKCLNLETPLLGSGLHTPGICRPFHMGTQSMLVAVTRWSFLLSQLCLSWYKILPPYLIHCILIYC